MIYPTQEQVSNAAIVQPRQEARGKLHPLGLTQVTLNDAFWQPRRIINQQATLKQQYQQIVTTGRLDNFRRAAGLVKAPFHGIFFNDSDVYKWLEAAAWTLATEKDAEIEQLVDETITTIAGAQQDDGYLNTYFMYEHEAERWTNIGDLHELYCAGHLFQAAVAHHRATGKRSLLDVAIRLADHIVTTFSPTAKAGACGHPEIEMALVELGRETGEERYIQQALFFLNQRGQQPPVISGSDYHQDHQPVREQQEVVGHAVRALYLYAGMADVYAETGDQTLDSAQETLWHNLISAKSYITGGVGSRWEGEAFGNNYELPNERAYTETCAAIASIMWNWRLLLLKGEARFSDVIETTLYNGMLSGLSLDGTEYFYQNPLADRGQHRRSPWFGTACCPPNIARTLAALPGYFYSTSDAGLWIHLYAASEVHTTLANGQTITLQQQTDYPWDEQITLHIQTEQPAQFSLFARIPAWARDARVQINNEPPLADVQAGTYTEIARTWQDGDVVHITLPMPVRLIESHPFVTSNHDRVAIARGPLIYCVEQDDHGDVDVWTLTLPGQTAWEIHRESDLLGGVVTLQTQAFARSNEDWSTQLYRPYQSKRAPYTPVTLKAIPYYAWANRAAGPMQVWLPIDTSY